MFLLCQFSKPILHIIYYKNQNIQSQVFTTPAFFTIHQLKQNAPTSGIYGTEGYVVYIYTCPPCPKGINCMPCATKNHIRISEENNNVDSATLTPKEIIILTDKNQNFEIGKKYNFEVEILYKRTTQDTMNDIKLVRFEEISDVK